MQLKDVTETVFEMARGTEVPAPKQKANMTLWRADRLELVVDIVDSEDYTIPLVLQFRVLNRINGMIQMLKLSKFIHEGIRSRHLQYTIDWWCRPLGSGAPGFVVVGFRPCDLRELVDL